jgi:dTDP-4-dehydrorhamnose 3,5-epimerase
MGPINLSEILLTPLCRISTPGGDILHAMKNEDVGFSGFGEAYFSLVGNGSIKAWKRHTSMNMNLVVPVGEVRFVFYCEANKAFQVVDIGEKNYQRITVPAGIWFGFQGRAQVESVVLNLADIKHISEEVERRTLAELKFEWA